MSRDSELYLDDMIEFCTRVLTYVRGFDQEQFERNSLVYDATLSGETRDIHDKFFKGSYSPDIDSSCLEAGFSIRNALGMTFLGTSNLFLTYKVV